MLLFTVADGAFFFAQCNATPATCFCDTRFSVCFTCRSHVYSILSLIRTLSYILSYIKIDLAEH